MKNSHIFNLKIKKFEQVCLFELCWGKGQTLTAQIDYPGNLNLLHQEWLQAYLNFYQSDEMRGRAVDGGVAIVNIDWHAELVTAESKLMYEFHRWLRSVELYDIRSQIARASQEVVQVFITCSPIELERYPWEAWEIGTEFANNNPIQIIRAPLNIAAPVENQNNKYRKRARILAILGDDTGLNFQAEKEAIKPILKIADVEFVGWQPEQTPSQVIAQISDAITDERGWDVLFFAGHSNESEMTGGELGIAPGVSISINEIAHQLSIAKKRGLNVAVFNSCSGLNIAQSLIELGFGQVVVMREPIHNRVAEEFLVRFLQGLAKHEDIYESVVAARQSLLMEKSHTYPSSYLVPSLFCHPGANLYRIAPVRWKDRLRQNLPNPIQGIVIAASLFLGIFPAIQDTLLNLRMLNQAVYRDVTTQISDDKAPPVALIEIDSESIFRAQLPNSQLLPLNRSYIANLVDRLRFLNATVVGIDFIFDSPQKNTLSGDKDLGLAVRRAVDANMWLIFGAVLQPNREIGINEAVGITKWNWSLQAYLDANPYFIQLPNPERDCRNACPFSYLLSLVQTAKYEIPDLPKPNLNRTTNLRKLIFDVIETYSLDKDVNKSHLSKLLNLPFDLALQPLVDYSLPPEKVYSKIPAWQLIENPDINQFPLISKQVVVIAVSSDERLGSVPGKPDRIAIPFATKYWAPQQDWMTGGQSLVYMTHHLLRNRFVTPIPDIWMILTAIIFGKFTVFILNKQSLFTPQTRLKILAGSLGAVTLYGLVSLQLYISASVLLPWLLPSIVFLSYTIPFKKKNHV
ncbi:MAG: CHASE2 domain-containing protein [Cyanobacteria bacterium P01_C01_bin.38]